MKKCPFCDAPLADQARFCLHCMRPLNEKVTLPPPRRKTPWMTTILLVALAVFLGLVLLLRENDQPSAPSTPESTSTVSSSMDTSSATAPTAPITQATQGTTQPSTQATTSTQPVTAPTQPTTTPTSPTTTPTQPTTAPHSHAFTRKVISPQYLQSEATCLSPARYYYACQCGAAGTETFSYGEITDHDIVKVNGIPATCTQEGTSDSYICRFCDWEVIGQTTTPPTGHSPVENICISCNAYVSTDLNFIINLPKLPLVQSDGFQITKCSYYIHAPVWSDGLYGVTFYVEMTNLTDAYEMSTPQMTLSGIKPMMTANVILQPGESGGCYMIFDDIPSGTYDLIFS